MNYQPPQSIVSDPVDTRQPTKTNVFFAIVGALLSALNFVCLGVFAYLLYEAFLGLPPGGAADPRLVSGSISSALVTASLYGLLGTAGLIVSVATLSVTPYRKTWFVRSTVVCACAALLFIPIGTVIGFVTLVVIFIKRRQLRQSTESGVDT